MLVGFIAIGPSLIRLASSGRQVYSAYATNTKPVDAKTGSPCIVLEYQPFRSTAIIKADVRDKKTYICVNGEQKRDYFSATRKIFRDIHDRFEKLEVVELIL
jgi:hypothetical protein